MSSTVLPRRADGRIGRRVEHVMGMPISLALRGRHAATVAGDEAWQAVITQLRRVDEIFSTYRTDSIVNRLDRGELSVEECPPEVAEVLALGDEAERISGGAFSIKLPTDDGRRRLDPSGVVKGWATQRASQTLAALDDTDFCLSAGGDMVCHTADPSRTAWRIGIEHPLDSLTLIAADPLGGGGDLRYRAPWRASRRPPNRSRTKGCRLRHRDRLIVDVGRHRRHDGVRARPRCRPVAPDPADPQCTRGLGRRNDNAAAPRPH